MPSFPTGLLNQLAATHQISPTSGDWLQQLLARLSRPQEPLGGLLLANRPPMPPHLDNPSRADGIISRSNYDPRVPNLPASDGDPQAQRDALFRNQFPTWGAPSAGPGQTPQMPTTLPSPGYDKDAERMAMISQMLMSAGEGVMSQPNIGAGLAAGIMGAGRGALAGREDYQARQDRDLQRDYMRARVDDLRKPAAQSRVLSPFEEAQLFGKDINGIFEQTADGSYRLIQGTDDSGPQDAWEPIKPESVGLPAGAVVSKNLSNGKLDVIYTPPAPDRPRQPTDFELRGAEIDRRYPKNSPQWTSAWNRLLLGDSGPTQAQVANNLEIEAARKRLDALGLDPTKLMASMQKQSDTGMDNPDYNPQIAHDVTVATQHMIGDDKDFDRYQSLFTPSSAPGSDSGGDSGGGAPAPVPPQGIPAAAIDMLKSNPALASYFDQKYGRGMAARYLLGGR